MSCDLHIILNALTHIVPATPCQSSDGQPHFSHGDPHMYSHHPSVSSMAATVGSGLAASHIPQPGTVTIGRVSFRGGWGGGGGGHSPFLENFLPPLGEFKVPILK